ncbi:MAG: hypothetical protein LBI09_00640 [Nitrososphaerota archaeon]|jgi:hypothetical protein|nr:hypothetical protein [Nitrososphaerota archaeon]
MSIVMKNKQQTTEGVWCKKKKKKKLYIYTHTHPKLREQNIATRPIQSGVTYAHVVQGQTEYPNKCNSAKCNEKDTTHERLNRTQTNDKKLNGPNVHSNKRYTSARQQKLLIIHLLKIAAWNANGLSQQAQEITFFLQTFNLDILLVSETPLHKQKLHNNTILQYILH